MAFLSRRISTCLAPKGLRLQLAVREVIKLGREQCQCWQGQLLCACMGCSTLRRVAMRVSSTRGARQGQLCELCAACQAAFSLFVWSCQARWCNAFWGQAEPCFFCGGRIPVLGPAKVVVYKSWNEITRLSQKYIHANIRRVLASLRWHVVAPTTISDPFRLLQMCIRTVKFKKFKLLKKNPLIDWRAFDVFFSQLELSWYLLWFSGDKN